MKHLPDIEKWKLLVKSDINQAASDFSNRPTDEVADMADKLGVAYMVNMISQLGTDVAADVLRNLPHDFRNKVIHELDQEKAKLIKEILSYKLATAGALMAKEYLSVPAHYTIQETTKYLQHLPQDKKGKVSYIYVVDQSDRLEGVIQVRDLVFHPPDRIVRDILKSPVVQVETGMGQMDVARLLQKHKYLGLPVVDKDQKLVGVISADVVIQAFEEEASDDIAKIVGTSVEEIRAHSVKQIVGFRLPWLFVNILSGLICAFISGLFQKDIETVVTLFLFVPVVLGLSESAGVQGATIVVRNIALGNISFRHLSALFVRESMVGLVIGSICGLTVGFVAFLWKMNPHIALALAGSMTLTIGLAALIGLLLPLAFRKLKIDPAIASGPLVLAICDIQTLILYFNISSFILR